MGCVESRSDGKALRIVGNIISTVSRANGREDVQLEIAVLAQLDKIKRHVSKRQTVHPLVLHEFNYAMTLLQQKRPLSLQTLRQEILETMLLITSKTPTAAVTVDNMAYLGEKDRSMSSSLNTTGKFTNAVAKYVSRESAPPTPMSTPERPVADRKRLSSSTVSETTSHHNHPNAHHHNNNNNHIQFPVPTGLTAKAPRMNDLESVRGRSRDERDASRSSETIGDKMGRFKSFYAQAYNDSEDTLSDFGFFDDDQEEEVIAGAC